MLWTVVWMMDGTSFQVDKFDNWTEKQVHWYSVGQSSHSYEVDVAVGIQYRDAEGKLHRIPYSAIKEIED